MSCNQRKAFTQVELIFVMIVVGILAAVAIPRLATSRDDANAARCTQETQQLISEISHSYAFEGYYTFSAKPIDKITNIDVGIVEGDGISSSLGSLVSDGVTYMCDSEDIVLIKGIHGGIDYNLTVTDLDTATSPAAVTASELIRKLHAISIAGGTRVYSLE